MPTLDNVLQEVLFGEMKVKVQNAKIVYVPEQDIPQPTKIDGIEKVTKIKKGIEIDQ